MYLRLANIVYVCIFTLISDEWLIAACSLIIVEWLLWEGKSVHGTGFQRAEGPSSCLVFAAHRIHDTCFYPKMYNVQLLNVCIIEDKGCAYLCQPHGLVQKAEILRMSVFGLLPGCKRRNFGYNKIVT